jgi:DNA-binding NtrC family response regulator
MDHQRILVIDDEKNIRLTLSTLLETLNYLVDIAVNGEEGVAKVREEEYVLAFLDMKMPGMDGIATLGHLKEIKPELNVIMMTAYGTIESAVEALKLGAVDYLRKPFGPEEIREIVATVIKRRSLDETGQNYESLVEYAKSLIVKRDFASAKQTLSKAVALESGNPEAFYLFGVLAEMGADLSEAKKMYRATLSLDPTHTLAHDNLHRLVEWK